MDTNLSSKILTGFVNMYLYLLNLKTIDFHKEDANSLGKTSNLNGIYSSCFVVVFLLLKDFTVYGVRHIKYNNIALGEERAPLQILVTKKHIIFIELNAEILR
jgi:hypothetical protein